MKNYKLSILIFCLFASMHINSQSIIEQSISVNSTGGSADASAMLDVNATDKGMLVPRLSTVQRQAIGSPATGLLVFDVDAASFWFFDGLAWSEIGAAQAVLQDADGDTKIQVEENPDEDIIRFDLSGAEKMVLQQNAYGISRLELPTTFGTTIIGYEAGANNNPTLPGISGIDNVFLGYRAGYANTSGASNVFLGKETGKSNSSGYANSGSGDRVLFLNTIGYGNTASGRDAMYSNTTGNYNSGIGERALHNNLSGSNNVALGREALLQNTTGSNNTALGNSANVLSNNLTNATAIGYNSQVGCSNCLVLGGTGAHAINVGIGTNTPSAGKLVVDAATTGTGLVNLGKLLIGTDTPLDGYNGSLLHINSSQYESRIILKGANGGSNYNSFLLRDNNGNGWDINHKAQVWNNHFLVFDYFDNASQTYKETLKLTSDGRVGLGYNWNEDSSNSKLSVKGGDVNIVDIGSGIIMKSPNGQCWRVTIDNSGSLSSASIACP